MDTAFGNIQKENARSVKLQESLDTIQSKIIAGYSTAAAIDYSNVDSLYKATAKVDMKDLKATKKNDTSNVQKENRIVTNTGNQKPGIDLKNKTGTNTIVAYQKDLSNSLIQLNKFESIILATALFKMETPNMSYFSLQKIYQTDDGENASKMIRFDCTRSVINKDSSIDFKFIERKDTNLEPLDPLNYNKDFAVSLNGSMYSPAIDCVIFWKDIAGRLFSTRIKLPLKK